MKKRVIFIFVILAVILAACGAAKATVTGSPEKSLGNPAYEGAAPQAGAPTAAPVEQRQAAYDEAGKGGGAAQAPAVQERMVIKTVDLTVVVADVDSKMTSIGQLAERYQGFVLSSYLYQVGQTGEEPILQATISIRVPADMFEAAIAEIKAVDVVEVRGENQYGQDVTAEYVDLKSQLGALETARDQLEIIMKNATKTEDVLAVFSQLQSYNQQIEIIKGQMTYYESVTSTALINVTILEEEKVKPIEVKGWKPGGVVNQAIESLVKFLQGFVDFIIRFFLFVLPMLLVIFGPPVLVIWLIIFLIRRSIRKKSAKKAAVQP
jgi:hypothetical protein